MKTSKAIIIISSIGAIFGILWNAYMQFSTYNDFRPNRFMNYMGSVWCTGVSLLVVIIGIILYIYQKRNNY